jgi:hypothetical protein
VAANGRLPASSLAPIGGGYFLRRDAAKAFNAMSAEARQRFGVSVKVVAGYRTFARQVYFWNLWRAGKGNLAAEPGSSNHGWGVAVDLASQRMRWIVDHIGAKYGFSKAWSDAPGEWWHIRFDPAHLTADLSPKKALRLRSTGPRVEALQRRLRALGFKSVPAPGHSGYGYFGRATRSAVIRFQRKHHLHADGIVGESTTTALRRT